MRTLAVVVFAMLCSITVFVPTRKLYQTWLLVTHKNDDFGAISVTERSCAASILKVDSHISDRFGATLRLLKSAKKR